jgi:hypothetical protein
MPCANNTFHQAKFAEKGVFIWGIFFHFKEEGAMKNNKALVWVLCSLFIFTVVGIAWAEEKTVTTTLIRVEGKKSVIFNNDQGKEINAEVSSGRSAIKIGGKSAAYKNLKAGMKMKITYNEDGGPNEPTLIEVIE